ncbi:MAG: PAS domain S-box protein [Candidatus Hydrogenedentales bacterium]|jgi:PAS domain S-box-containing protein
MTHGTPKEAPREKDLSDSFAYLERQCQALVSNDVVVHAASDRDGRFVVCNDRFLEVLGYTRAELLALRDVDITHPDDRDATVKYLEDLFQGKRDGIRLEKRFVRKNGALVWCDLTLSALRDEAGAFIAVVGAGLDISDRKRVEADRENAERCLRESRDLFERVLTSSPAMLFTLRLEDGRFVPEWGSENIQRILGYTTQEALTPGWWQSNIHPEDRAEALARSSLVLESGTLTQEYRFRRRDGVYVWLLDEMRLIAGAGSGQPVIVGAWSDITDRKSAELEVRRQKEFLQTLLQHIPVMVSLTDREGNLMWVNDCWEKSYGWLLAEARVRDILADLCPDPVYREYVRRAFVAATGAWNDLKLYTRGGRLIESSVSMVRMSDGSIVAIGVDLTERRRQESEILQQSVRSEALLRMASDGVVVLDSEGNVTEVSQSFCRMLGYTQEELLKRKVTDWDALKDRDQIAELMRATGQEGGVFETQHRRKDGSVYDVEISSCRVSIRGQDYYYCACRDVSERHRMQKRLAESEHKYRALFETSNDPILVLDGIRIADCNPSAVRVLGISLEQLLAQSLLDFTPAILPDGTSAAERIAACIGRALRGHAEQFEWRYVRADGTPIDFHVALSLFSAGERPQIQAVMRDISALKNAQAALRESEDRFRSVFEHSPVGMATVTLDGVYLKANAALCAMVGMSESEIVGKDLRDFTDPADWEEHLGMLRQLVAGEIEIAVYQKRYIRSDGQRIWASVHASLVRDHNGNPAYIVAQAEDITERREAESERARLVAAIDAAAEAVVITDTKGVILYAKPAFERITGHRIQDVVGSNPRVLKSGRHNDAFYETMWSTIVSDKVWSGRMVNRRKDGSLYTEEMTISPVKDASGHTSNFVAVKRDVTEELRMEESLRQSQKMQAIGTLAGGIAHDFNNILAAILGYAELLAPVVKGHAQAKEDVSHIRASALRARDLVQQILTFSRQKERERHAVRVDIVVADAVRLLRSTISKSIQIVADIEPSHCTVMADEAEIHQIIVNLCTNAYHAMGESEGTLGISLCVVHVDNALTAEIPELSPGPHLKLSVSDTGCGMDETTKERIWEPFFTTKEQGKGTGLGLATVHGIVKALGGAVTLDSAPNRGSTFAVYLPCLVEPALPDGKRQVQTLEGNERILVVDDEQHVASVVGRMLGGLGYQVTEMILSGREVFDLLVTDQQMPGLTGKELAGRLRAARNNLPIVIMTGFSETITPESAAEMGVSGFLYKPLDSEELAAAVREALDSAKAARESR